MNETEAAPAARRTGARGRKGKAARRDEVLDVALSLFAERGFQKTTLHDVAAAIGIGAPALYYYYPSKEALLFWCLRRTMEQLNQQLSLALDARRTSSPARKLAALVETQVRFELSSPDFMPVINGYLYGALRNSAHFEPDQVEALRVMQLETVNHYRAALRDGVSRGDFAVDDVNTTTFAILGMAQYVSTWFRSRDGALSIERVAALHADLALRMVGFES